MVLIGSFGAFVLLLSYSVVAFSDPGIVYKELDEEELLSEMQAVSDPEMYNNNPGSGRVIPEIYKSTPKVIQKLDCGHCKIKRPITSSQ